MIGGMKPDAYAFFLLLLLLLVLLFLQARSPTSARGRAASGDSPGATS